MSVVEVLAELMRLGVQLVADRDRLRYQPRSAVSPELLGQLAANKVELLEVLIRQPIVVATPEDEKPTPTPGDVGICVACNLPLVENPTFDGFLNLDCPKCYRCFGCRPSSEEVASRFNQPTRRDSTGWRLVGNDFPPIPTKKPPAEILADPVVMCKRCGEKRVLAAVPGCERGLCYDCWSSELDVTD